MRSIRKSSMLSRHNLLLLQRIFKTLENQKEYKAVFFKEAYLFLIKVKYLYFIIKFRFWVIKIF